VVRAQAWLRDGAMGGGAAWVFHFLPRSWCAGCARFVRLLFFGKGVVACAFLASVTPNNSFKPTPLRGAA